MGLDKFSKLGSFEEMADEQDTAPATETPATEATTEEVKADNTEPSKAE